MIKLNSFILPDNVIEKMKHKLREGIREERELGFSLCSSDNIIKVGEACTGGDCSVSLPEKCPEENDIYVASYHTHVHESSRPSGQDIPIIYKKGLGCIGGETEEDKEEIKCYLRTGPKDIDKIDSFKYGLNFIRDRYERRATIDKFVSENFKVFNVI